MTPSAFTEACREAAVELGAMNFLVADETVGRHNGGEPAPSMCNAESDR